MKEFERTEHLMMASNDPATSPLFMVLFSRHTIANADYT